MMRLFLAELKKLLLLFKADPRALAAGLIAPTVILLVFALTFGGFTSLKLAWVDEDESSYSAQLEESIFSQISPLGDRPYFEAVVAEREEAQALYDAGKVNGIVACSEGFGAALARGEKWRHRLQLQQLQHRHGEKVCASIWRKASSISTAPPTAICSLRCVR